MATVIGGGWLRDDAAAQFNALQHAAKARFGTFMPVTSAGRTKAEQARLYNGWVRRLPGFSPAYPPDSPYALHVVNGGAAVDVGGAFGVANTTPHLWLKENGPKYGYAVDAVAGEPWHIQFTLKPSIAGTKATPIPVPEEEDEDMPRIIYHVSRGYAQILPYGHIRYPETQDGNNQVAAILGVPTTTVGVWTPDGVKRYATAAEFDTATRSADQCLAALLNQIKAVV